MNTSRFRGSALLMFLLLPAHPSPGQSSYPRAGWETHLVRTGHGVAGTATIVDERTIRLTHFSYDGLAPDMYVHVATNLARRDFELDRGRAVGPRLARRYRDETHVVQLPEGQTLDGWTSVSIWCVTVNGSFGWGTFHPPNRPALQVTRRADSVEVHLNGEAGQRYWLQRTDGMAETAHWQNLVLLTNKTGGVRYTNSMVPGLPGMFLRAVRD